MWNKVKLREVLRLEKDNLIKINPDKEYVVAGVQNYGKGVLNKRTVMGTELKMKEYQLLNKNQLIWCKVDTRNGAFGISTENNIGSVVSTNMHVTNINEKIAYPKYIKYLFLSKNIQDIIENKSTGSTNRRYLKINGLFEIEIPLPPLSEQLTIVEKLEKATTKLKQIKQLRAESLKETEMLKSGFIDKILNELKTKNGSVLISKSKLQINPENINPINEFKNNEFIYIDIASVEQETSYILEYKKILGINAPSRARRLMRANDVVLSSVRPNLKKCFIVDSKLDNQVCSTGFIVFRFDENYCNPTFLKLQFLSDWFINQCMESVTGGHYPALNDNNLQKLELVILPIEIQNQIVNEIENFNKKLESIKNLQQQTEAEITAMEKSILNKYIQTN